jgi:hypothetical protein
MSDEVIVFSEADIAELTEMLIQHQNMPVVQSKVFVFYEAETGKIQSISSNETEVDYPYIEIKTDREREIVSRLDVFYRYKVSYDPDRKEFLLLEVNLDIEEFLRIDDIIFQYPTVDEIVDQAVIVEQNIYHKKWKVYLGDKFFEEMQQKPSQVDYFNIYITDQNDPNILHRTITVSFADLIKHRSSKVDFESELEMEPLSVFSRNHFPSHAHIFKK